MEVNRKRSKLPIAEECDLNPAIYLLNHLDTPDSSTNELAADEEYDDEGHAKKKRNKITLDIKREIISRKDAGAKYAELSAVYGLSRSTLSSIMKQREKLLKNKPADGYSRVSEVRLRNTICPQMEEKLILWIIEQQMKGKPNSEEGIANQARIFFDELRLANSQGSKDDEDFKASKGWFINFKARTGLQKIAVNEADTSSGKTLKPKILYIVKPSEIEEDRKSFTCPRCTCKTMGRKEFLKHLSSHSCGAILECKICKKKLPSRSALDVHVKAHEKMKPKDYPCKICGGRYKFHLSYLKHLKIHEEEAALLRQEHEEHIEQEVQMDQEDPLEIKTEIEEESDAEDFVESEESSFMDVLIKTEN